MNIIEAHLAEMLVAFAIAAIVQIPLLWRRVNNIADPLVFFAITSAFTLGLAYYAVDTVALYIRVILYFAFFYAGLLLATKPLRQTSEPLMMSFGLQRFKVVVMISCIVFLTGNILVWMKSGVILFSDDPSLQKSISYADGFGFVRRINWGLGVFALVSALYWWILERSRVALAFLIFAILVSAVGGGKSALLPMIFSLGLYFLNPFRPVRDGKRMPTRRILLFAAGLAIIPVGAVLLIESDSPLNALFVRLFFSGDVLLYWGQSDLRAHFSKLGVIDYVRDSFGSLLGMLRLIEYSTPIGNQFVQYSLPVDAEFSEWLGPNIPFYVRGELYFGPWLGIFHSLLIGYVVGRVRMLFVGYRGKSPLRYSISAVLVCIVTALPVEEGLAISQLTDFILVLALVLFIASVLASNRRSLSWRPAITTSQQK